MPPLFEFSDHFPTTVQIGDKAVSIKVKRYSRDEMDALTLRWEQHQERRGTKPIDDAAKKALERESRLLLEELIVEGVTLEEGLIIDKGRPVVDGRGLIGVFHQRPDVLSDLAAAVLLQNRLAGTFAKNSNSRRGSDLSLEQSSPARRGDAQGSTAIDVERSTSAPTEAVTALSSDSAEAPASSGMAREAMAAG